jgi:uncharacterized protein (DUF1810 family)
MQDPFDLQRFCDAQAPVIDTVREELRAGRKRSHWMWFVFPQLAGLGTSPMAQRYAIGSLEEARAYLAHPVLGDRLRECCRLLLDGAADDIHAILGSPDDMKLRSCVTLFRHAAPREAVFSQCLARFYGGEPDERTLALLAHE